MGILDAPAPATTAETFALLTSRLQLGAQDATLLVMGDSTGNDSNEWVYLTTQWLATQYPAYTVTYRLYNDTTKTYDAPVTIQTGTGARTLAVYNASVSGMDTAYSITNFTTQTPVAPDLVIVSYSHNSTGNAAYRPILYNLTRLLEDNFPAAGIVVTAQNPRLSNDADYTNAITRCQQVMALAASEGYGLINITQTFLNNASYGSAWIESGSPFLHPNATGQQVWANVVKQHLRKSTSVVPRAVPPRPHRVFVPAGRFIASEGAPTLGVFGTNPFPAWSFDQTTQQGIIGHAEWPHTWQSVNLYAIWNVATGTGHTGSDGCRWEIGLTQASANSTFVGPAATGSTTSQAENALSPLLVTGFPLNSAAWETITTRFPFVPTYKGRPIIMRVRRIAADATDTLAETAYLQGIIVERAS